MQKPRQQAELTPSPEPKAQGVMAPLNRLWRAVMTGVCFVVFGVGGVILSAVWFKLLLLLQRNRLKRRKIARASISWSFRLFYRFAHFVRVLEHEVQGAEVLRSDQGVLVVANHPTLLDYVLLAAYLPQLDCIVKADLLRNPFLRGVVKAADYLINNEDPEQLLQACQKRLDAGGVILIFPEGTRTRKNTAVKLQRGAANIAVRCRSNLRLVKICCTPPVVTKGSHWYQAPRTKPTLYAQAQGVIEIDRFLIDETQQPVADSVAVRRLTEHLTAHIAPFKTCTFGMST